MGYSPQGRKESDTTEPLSLSFHNKNIVNSFQNFGRKLDTF